MKKLILITLIALTVFSCKKADTASGDLKSTWITGKWKRTVSYLDWVENNKSYKDTIYTSVNLTFVGGRTGKVISSEEIIDQSQTNVYILDSDEGSSFIDFWGQPRRFIKKVNDKEFYFQYQTAYGPNMNKLTIYTDTYKKIE